MESFRTSERSLWWLHTSISVTESMPWVRAALCLATENTEGDAEKRECPLLFIRLLCFLTPAISHPVLAKSTTGMKLSAQGADLFLFALHLSGRISTQKTDVLSHADSAPRSCTQPGARESTEQSPCWRQPVQTAGYLSPPPGGRRRTEQCQFVPRNPVCKVRQGVGSGSEDKETCDGRFGGDVLGAISISPSTAFGNQCLAAQLIWSWLME